MSFLKKKEKPASAPSGVKEYIPLDKQLYDIEAENLADIVGKPVEVYPTKSAVMFTEYADVLLAINFGGLEATDVADETADVLDADNIEFEDNEFVETTGTKYDGDLEPIPQDEEIPEASSSDSSLADDLLSENEESGINSDTNQSSPSNNGINNTEEGDSMANVDEMVETEMADYANANISDGDPSFDDAETDVVEDVEDTEGSDDTAATEETEAVEDAGVIEDAVESGSDDTADVEETDDTADGKSELAVTGEDTAEFVDEGVPEDTKQGKKLIIPNDKPKSIIRVEEPADEAVVPAKETKTSIDDTSENLPEFYTNNSQLILLLRKMGILDIMEQLATDNDITEAELLKATSNIRKLNTAYGDAEALAVTYLESRGIDFHKLVGESCLKYKAEQILFIGEKVSKGFEPIDAILNPAYSIAQMQCICDLEARGNINTMAFCTPNFSPSTMKQLADVYQTGADMSVFKEFVVLTWHGVTLIHAALLAGVTEFDEYKTTEGVLDENKLFSHLKDINTQSDANVGTLGADGLTYVL